ncbi:trehalose-phosphatase [Candidatus Daviesbacteria bacterium RIFCSPHIGHO2_02_FULL_41_10]|uniref:Trehalose 6-phosphate phosphatase n=2 Tax=Candidatus Daviesiibacteriota TaxID=1752718 RepID=A0A1F5IR00_9BACT|nr:MAG: trehalose-phosphatase [Candidatus Daviesbacteria bacterium RIFCSPHIGHO2_01_FULL_41_23]OGE33236.1 MAG: trehalose-phosphatase [Candidatus Daviesbacteria bacterium RIFCSPHIGHO2_02_FULL_41_10]
MRDLWQNLRKITALLENDKPKLLLFDFDGTLAPIAKSPREAKLSPKTKSLLQQLSAKKDVYLAIVSGRRLDDIKARIGLSNIIYGGNHGLEGEILGEKYSFPIPNKMFRDLRTIKDQLDKLATKFNGVLVEDKGLTLSFHYRLAEEKLIAEITSLINEVLQPFVTNQSVSVMVGKKVTDISPNVNWNKGCFASLIIDRITERIKTSPVVIIIGDDKTDENVFRMFDKGISIRVGTSSRSKAKYKLRDTQEVFEFLKYINLMTQVNTVWPGLIRDASGRWQKYHRRGIKYFKYGSQPKPDLTDREQFNLLVSSIASEKAFIEGLLDRSFENIEDWLIKLHKIQAYKGIRGKLLTVRRISRGEHSKIAKLAILPLARKYADPYINEGVQTLYLLNISDEGLPRDRWINSNSVIHSYPDPKFSEQYLQVMEKALDEFMRNIKSSDKNKLLLLIARYYQYAINMHMFEHVNQTLFCNQLNAMLKLINQNPIEHGVLDFAAMRLQPENFTNYFIDEVNHFCPR